MRKAKENSDRTEAIYEQVLKSGYEEEGKRDDADIMYFLERRANRQLPSINAKITYSNKTGKEKIIPFIILLYSYLKKFAEWLIADISCKYGTSWFRPISLWFGTVLIAFPFCYWLCEGIKTISSGWSGIFEYVYFSIVTATTLGFGDYQPALGMSQVFASIEAIFGLFMWAIFLTVFSRKYMR